MPKGVQSSKMAKKPKKDTSAPAPVSSPSTRPTPPVTAVIPRGKPKDK